MSEPGATVLAGSPPAPSSGEWLSLHVFFDGSLFGAEADRVILDVVAPVVDAAAEQGWSERYFFVRYSEGGPHIRLRMFGDPADVEWRISVALSAAAERAGRTVRPQRVPYEPETDRYGGPDGVALAERLFQASSDAAIALLRGMPPGDSAPRLGKAVLAMLVLLHEFLRDRHDTVRLLHQYETSYLRMLARTEEGRDRATEAFGGAFDRQADHLSLYVQEGWARLDAREALSASLDPFAATLCSVRHALDRLEAEGRLLCGGRRLAGTGEAVRYLLPSYLHMMNNRLGVPVSHEAYLASVIRRALAAPVLA